jgi:hypothetical protein
MQAITVQVRGAGLAGLSLVDIRPGTSQPVGPHQPRHRAGMYPEIMLRSPDTSFDSADKEILPFVNIG